MKRTALDFVGLLGMTAVIIGITGVAGSVALAIITHDRSPAVPIHVVVFIAMVIGGFLTAMWATLISIWRA